MYRFVPRDEQAHTTSSTAYAPIPLWSLLVIPTLTNIGCLQINQTCSDCSGALDLQRLARQLKEEINLFTPTVCCLLFRARSRSISFLINHVFPQHVYVQLHNEAVLVRVKLYCDRPQYNPKMQNAAFFAYYPRSHSLFACSIPHSFRNIIIHALGMCSPTSRAQLRSFWVFSEMALEGTLELTELSSSNLSAHKPSLDFGREIRCSRPSSIT